MARFRKLSAGLLLAALAAAVRVDEVKEDPADPAREAMLKMTADKNAQKLSVEEAKHMNRGEEATKKAEAIKASTAESVKNIADGVAQRAAAAKVHVDEVNANVSKKESDSQERIAAYDLKKQKEAVDHCNEENDREAAIVKDANHKVKLAFDSVDDDFKASKKITADHQEAATKCADNSMKAVAAAEQMAVEESKKAEEDAQRAISLKKSETDNEISLEDAKAERKIKKDAGDGLRSAQEIADVADKASLDLKAKGDKDAKAAADKAAKDLNNLKVGQKFEMDAIKLEQETAEHREDMFAKATSEMVLKAKDRQKAAKDLDGDEVAQKVKEVLDKGNAQKVKEDK